MAIVLHTFIVFSNVHRFDNFVRVLKSRKHYYLSLTIHALIYSQHIMKV